MSVYVLSIFLCHIAEVLQPIYCQGLLRKCNYVIVSYNNLMIREDEVFVFKNLDLAV